VRLADFRVWHFLDIFDLASDVRSRGGADMPFRLSHYDTKTTFESFDVRDVRLRGLG
jgi:hypothetical protein